MKRLGTRLIARSAIPELVRRRRHPSAVILAYHNIVPFGKPSVGEPSLHIPRDDFVRHLDLLQDSYEVVTLEEILTLPGDPTRRPRAAVTFDDAYQGTMTAGVDELVSRGLPGTVFVPPALLGTRGFWWDLLISPESDPDPEIRDHCLTALEGRQDRILAWAAEHGIQTRPVPAWCRPADPPMLLEQGGRAGITLAPHTWSHANLAALRRDEIREEIDRSRRWLKEREVRFIDCLAYPYGLWTEEAAFEAAACSRGAVVNAGGLVRVNGDLRGAPALFPRINVPRGLSVERLSLKLAGIRP